MLLTLAPQERLSPASALPGAPVGGGRTRRVGDRAGGTGEPMPSAGHARARPLLITDKGPGACLLRRALAEYLARSDRS